MAESTANKLLMRIEKEQTVAQDLGPGALGALPIIKSKGVVLLASLWLPTRVNVAWPIKGGCPCGSLMWF